MNHIVKIFKCIVPLFYVFTLMLDADSLLKVAIMVDLGATQLAVMIIDNFFRNLLENLALHSPHYKWHHFEVQFF